MAGKYTDITELTAPSSAAPGSKVSITVKVFNKTDKFYIAVTGGYNGAGFSFSPDYVMSVYGSTYTFTGSFTMPATKVRVLINSWVWDGTKWIVDDYMYKDIAVTAIAEPSFRNFKVLDYSKA